MVEPRNLEEEVAKAREAFYTQSDISHGKDFDYYMSVTKMQQEPTAEDKKQHALLTSEQAYEAKLKYELHEKMVALETEYAYEQGKK